MTNYVAEITFKAGDTVLASSRSADPDLYKMLQCLPDLAAQVGQKVERAVLLTVTPEHVAATGGGTAIHESKGRDD